MLNEKLLNALNEQIKNEIESSYLYLSMAAYFHSINLDGMAHWMRCQAHEEMIHGMKFYGYILDRGEKVVLKNLASLKTKWENPLEAWKDAFAHEQKVTANINELIRIAREVNDYRTEPLLAWFLEEQIEEEATSSKIGDDVEMVGNDKSGLLMLDRELSARVFPAGSPFDPVALKLA